MIIIAKQKNHNSKLHIKEFKNAPEAAHYLNVNVSTIYQSMGKYGKNPHKVKEWVIYEEK